MGGEGLGKGRVLCTVSISLHLSRVKTNDEINIRGYYKESIQLYERLTMLEASHGRALFDLGRLQVRHGAAGGEQNIAHAQRLFAELSGKERPETGDADANPFAGLIHPFYC